MADPELVRIAKTIVWHYKHDPEELAEVLSGERERVGQFDKQRLFVRMLTRLPWHRTVTALGIEEVKRLLTPEVIAMLWPPGLRESYARVRSTATRRSCAAFGLEFRVRPPPPGHLSV